MYDLVVSNARLYPMDDGLVRSPHSGFAVRDGCIAAFDPPAATPARARHDAGGGCVLPGFIDCHTHALYVGDRMAEHGERLRGATYAEIAARGGGIQTTVRAVRAASEAELVHATWARLAALAREGVTTVEIKSGYGLDLETELKMLRAIAALRADPAAPVDVVATFLALHAVPQGADRTAFVTDAVERWLPAVAAASLARAVDVYVEHIAFSNDDLTRLAAAARSHGLALRAHTDQLSNLGGTARAAALGALSCDHLEHAGPADVAAMAAAGTVAVLLPFAYYFLRDTQPPPVAALRAAGVPIAVATDLNPGTSPCCSLLTALHLGTVLFGLTAEEALLGATRNAARALGLADRGTLSVGQRADFTVWDLSGPEHLVYQMGGLRPTARFLFGEPQGDTR
jgi:imidazolonepropionase